MSPDTSTSEPDCMDFLDTPEPCRSCRRFGAVEGEVDCPACLLRATRTAVEVEQAATAWGLFPIEV